MSLVRWGWPIGVERDQPKLNTTTVLLNPPSHVNDLGTLEGHWKNGKNVKRKDSDFNDKGIILTSKNSSSMPYEKILTKV